jgi:hypothetical protein
LKAAFITLITPVLLAQTPAVPPQPPAPAPIPPVSGQAPVQDPNQTKTTLRAQYSWGYAGMEGEGKGTLSILVEPTSGKVIMELHGLGERLVYLSGDRASGYRVQIPRRELDLRGASFNELPLPFLPQLGTAEALYKLLSEGSGPGVKVTKRDGKGPVKLQYSGQDEHGKEVMVWLERTRWEIEESTPG